jgi:hypothetical protein
VKYYLNGRSIMSNKDELLQKHLASIENGTPVDKVLADLPDDMNDLAPLISLVAAMKSLPHPKPQLAYIHALKHKIMTAAQEIRLPLRPSAHNGHRRLELGSLGWTIAPAFAGVLLLLVMLSATMVGVLLWINGPSGARAATLTNISGQVEVTSADVSGGWEAAANGVRVSAGQRIRTQSDSTVTLAFFDGTRTTLEANTEVTLSEVKGDWGKVIHVAFTQTAGKTLHNVVPFMGKTSSYIVLTPSGSASVHGTTFSVAVDPSGKSRFSVSSGEVLVKNSDQEISLEAGQVTSAQQDQAPDSAAYEFSLQGQLTAKDTTTNIWEVLGIEFTVVPGETDIPVDPQVGEDVIVEGHITDTGDLIADSIMMAEDYSQFGSFTGSLDSIGIEEDANGRTQWDINGRTVLVDETTDLDDDLSEGDTVRVTFKILKNGSWLATEIDLLEEKPEEEPSPEPSETPETISETITISTTTPITDCTGANPPPKANKLAEEYGVDYTEIMGWFCQHFGFGEIDLAYGLNKQYPEIPVEQIFELRSSGLGWGLIKKQVPALAASITPSTTMTTTVEGPEITENDTPELPKSLTKGKGAVYCDGSTEQNPAVLNLARRFGATYEEVIGYYCQGFKLGDINHAYMLSAQTGTSPGEILALRSEGMNWGEIQKELMGNPGKDKGKP